MRTSETRILTTHVGSLPRPPMLTELLLRQERGDVVDEAELARQVETAVEMMVRKQLEVGIDIGNYGEQPRVAFHTYVARRMRGFGGGWAFMRPYSMGVIALFPRRRTLSLRECGCLRGAPCSGMVEVSNNPHASDQEPLYGAYYTDKGLVDNHLAAFSGTTLRRTRPWGSPD